MNQIKLEFDHIVLNACSCNIQKILDSFLSIFPFSYRRTENLSREAKEIIILMMDTSFYVEITCDLQCKHGNLMRKKSFVRSSEFYELGFLFWRISEISNLENILDVFSREKTRRFDSGRIERWNEFSLGKENTKLIEWISGNPIPGTKLVNEVCSLTIFSQGLRLLETRLQKIGICLVVDYYQNSHPGELQPSVRLGKFDEIVLFEINS